MQQKNKRQPERRTAQLGGQQQTRNTVQQDRRRARRDARQDEQKKPTKRGWWRVALAVLLVALAAGEAFWAYKVLEESRPTPDSFPKPVVFEPPAKEPKFVPPVTITISFAGDCTLGTDENFDYSTSFNAYYDNNGGSYFFKGVKDIFENDDLTVVNCEGVLTNATTREDKEYAYKGDPSFAKIFVQGGVEAAGVSNNHIYDYGWDSRGDTINALKAADLTVFGDDVVGYTEVNGKKIALIAGNMLTNHLSEEDNVLPRIRAAQEKGADIIIVQMHWGEMEEYNPMDEQIQLAHDCIDAGATVVVGSHQHVLQGYEEYKGHYIVYGLGNFCYGGSRGLFDPDCYIFQQTFTFIDGELQLDDNVEVIPCLISSDREYNNYQPIPADGDEKARVQKKIADSNKYIAEH